MKIKVLEKNNELILSGLVFGTFGNTSAKEGSSMLIKPSGVDLSLISKNDFSIVEINSGKLVSGKKPLSDTPTHLELYRSFPQLGGITHTHSPCSGRGCGVRDLRSHSNPKQQILRLQTSGRYKVL